MSILGQWPSVNQQRRDLKGLHVRVETNIVAFSLQYLFNIANLEWPSKFKQVAVSVEYKVYPFLNLT